MIGKGNTHNDGVKLAHYLTEGKKGERAELGELRGFASDDILEAFRSVHVMADATRCEQPFFHVQVRNPEGEKLTREQWQYAAKRYESMLGLTGQPRAISFHTDEKTGHEHMHIAWSRIDDDTMTAKPLPFFKERLIKTSRELELHFNLTRVKSERGSPVKAPNRDEYEQARRLGVDIKDVRKTIRNCWDRSDNGQSFRAALADEGLTLAQGERRDFIVIDRAGGMHAVSKRIVDMTAAQIRERMADLDRKQLPTVEQARDNTRELGGAKERPAPIWDRDQHDMEWQDAVINAAIEKEKIERRFIEPERQPAPGTLAGGKEAGREHRPFEQPLAPRSDRSSPEAAYGADAYDAVAALYSEHVGERIKEDGIRGAAEKRYRVAAFINGQPVERDRAALQAALEQYTQAAQKGATPDQATRAAREALHQFTDEKKPDWRRLRDDPEYRREVEKQVRPQQQERRYDRDR